MASKEKSSSKKNTKKQEKIVKKDKKTAFAAIAASFTQLWGYGSGLLIGWWNICILGKSNYAAFVKNFYR